MVTAARADGRLDLEPRKISISFDGLARVDGSASFGFGNTLALASISGPMEARLSVEQPSQATFEVLVRPITNVAATDSKALASTIRSILTPSLMLSMNPRTLSQLVIQSLATTTTNTFSKNSLAAAMINASALALMNAGSIPMRGVVCAVALGQREASSAFILDPSEDEISALGGGGCLAFMFSAHSESDETDSVCVWTNWRSKTGLCSERDLKLAKEIALGGARQVYDAMRNSLSNHILANQSDKLSLATHAVDDKMEI